jgi:adenylosuccinate lyase
LQIVINVARGLVVYPQVIESYVQAELPFMATEEILMAGVRSGGDRQVLHEKIRQHSQAAAEQVKTHGRPNDLLARLEDDPSFTQISFSRLLDPKNFYGRAPQQVDSFINEVVEPIRKRYHQSLAETVQLKV